MDKFAIHRVLFLEDGHIQVLQVNLPGERLGTASLPGLRATIEIFKIHVITEATYDVEAQPLDSGDKALLGEVGVNHNEIADGQQLLAYA